MAVTLGFMFRVDHYPSAAAVPPPSPPPAQSNPNNLVIEAESVKETGVAANPGQMQRGLSRNMQYRSGEMPPPPPQPLTYNQKGSAREPLVGGRLLDTYA